MNEVVVVGAGFGGLGAALSLAEAGRKVVLFEALNYPGGCAGTFKRGGTQYEAGATLFSGFGEGHLFAKWIERHAMNVHVDWLDPLVTLRCGDFELDVPPDRQLLVERLCRLAPGDAPKLRAFFESQERIADVLWGLFKEHELLPPFDVRSLLRHVARLPRYAPLLRWLGRPLSAFVRAHGLAECRVLRVYLDAVCQITVQADSAEAETLFALGAMDYFFRGTAHVRGGIGELAWAMVRAIEALGGEVRFTDRVDAVSRDGAGFVVRSRKSTLRAEHVVLNLLPADAARLSGVALGENKSLRTLDAQVKGGWGAAMIYARLRPDVDVPASAHHFELVAQDDAAFVEGNHIFCSVSALAEDSRAKDGERTMTVSTHVPMSVYRAMGEDEQALYIASVQETMRETLALRAPELASAMTFSMTGSPRTFERFTRREGGFVGGIPRRAGLHHYTSHLGPLEIERGLWLVGDTAFPGQSTLATALGGVRTASAITAKSRRALRAIAAGPAKST